MTAITLPTRNTEWGFWGAINRLENRSAADPAEVWTLASNAIAKMTGDSPEGVRDFLDSRHGRHFADDVANGLCKGETLKIAIDNAVARVGGLTGG